MDEMGWFALIAIVVGSVSFIGMYLDDKNQEQTKQIKMCLEHKDNCWVVIK